MQKILINGLSKEQLTDEYKRINDAYFIRPNDRSGLKRAMLLMKSGTEFYDINQDQYRYIVLVLVSPRWLADFSEPIIRRESLSMAQPIAELRAIGPGDSRHRVLRCRCRIQAAEDLRHELTAMRFRSDRILLVQKKEVELLSGDFLV